VVEKNKIWGKKITAAFFMLVLFAVTTTQVLHRHTSNLKFTGKSNAGKQTKQIAAHHTNVSASACFICDYQLTKDADASYFLPQQISNTSFYSFSYFSYSFTPIRISTFFETRGPPSFI
jgi:hypothetical protein